MAQEDAEASAYSRALQELRQTEHSRPGLQRADSQRARDMAMARLMGAGPADNADDPLSPSFRTAGPPPTLEELQKRHVNQPASPNPAAPSQQRQEARTNLIRKLSRGREQGPKPKEIPLQPFEDSGLARSDSAASTVSRAKSSSTAPTSLESGHSRDGSNGKVEVPITYSSSDAESSPTEVLHSRASQAPSMYRPYRHTMERDRDSAFARLTAEDVWEFDNSSGAEGDSPRFPISPKMPPPVPSPNPALLAALAQEDRARQGSNSSSVTLQPESAVDAVGLGLTKEQNGWSGPEPGYRFPGPTPAHSLEHAALRAQPRMTGSPASTASFRSANSRPSPRRDESPVDQTPSRRPRSSSLSQHSTGRRPSDAAEVLSNLPARRSSKSKIHQRADSLVNGDDSSEADEWEESARKRVAASSATQMSSKERILNKLGSILQAAEERGNSSMLDDPPRRLLLDVPVLQVVNANTVKDRYLFLFNDILLIAKPMVEEDGHGEVIPPSLDTRFLVKSVVEVNQLRLTAIRDDDELDPAQKKKHPSLLAFIDRFASDPHRAVQMLVQRGGIANDPHVIAGLLFRTSELDRSQLAAYLSAREARPVLKAFVERFKLAGIRIEDAIRSFLASVRLPNDLATAEHLLNVFANVWLANNPSTSQDTAFAKKLVIATLELNDFLNSSSNDIGEGALGTLFGFANAAVTVEDFVAAFRSKDLARACPDETLVRIYMSIKSERLQQAADNSKSLTDVPVSFSPTRMPSRLTFRVPTQLIIVTIPEPDADFSIRLIGQDLKVEPSTLSFASSRTQSFRVTGLALGVKTLLFLKLGANAMLYSNVPINRSFSVERAFMKHTFQIAFVNHLNVKRKYMFSLSEATQRTEWVTQLHETIKEAPSLVSNDRATRAGKAVALQVLRDAIIAPDDALMVNGMPLNRSKPSSRPGSAKTDYTGSGRLGHQRSNSVSKVYAAGPGREEQEDAQSLPALPDSPAGSRMGKARAPLLASPSSNGISRRGSQPEGAIHEAMLFDQSRTGHELVTLARQNSLLPSVLGLMNSLQDPTPY